MFKELALLMKPPPGMNFDFGAPIGEPALIGADSLSWRIFKNPVALYVGGVAAVILELAEPSVRAGVWDHSSFREDPALRLRRTGFAAMMTVYGPRESARKMIGQIVKMHDRVEGVTAEGLHYRANDPRLLDWVQATASFGFIHAYTSYVRPLSETEKSQAFAEGQAPAKLYGAVGAPGSLVEWEALLERTLPGLEGSAILEEFLDLMKEAPILPGPARKLQRLFVRAAIEMTPDPVKRKIGLSGQSLQRGERIFLNWLGRVADRVPVPGAPPSLAARRVGLKLRQLYG